MKKRITNNIPFTLLLFCCLLPLSAHSNSMGDIASQSAKQDDGQQERFYKGRTHAGISVGPGLGVQMLGSGVKHDMVLLFAHYGKVISEVRAEDKWNHGNWEVVGEAFGGTQFWPDHSYLVGLDTVMRYNFLPFENDSPWTFFTDIGGGVAMTDIGGPDLSNGFQFNIQLGAGTHYFVSDNLAITGTIKALHLSNAGTDHPNNGLNSFFLMLGLSWFFK